MMATRRREIPAGAGGSLWWGGAGGEGGQGGGGFPFGEMSENELAALAGGYELQEVAVEEAPREELDSDLFQLSYPRPRLRWTTELHDHFVMAVDQLGGANKATPKGIRNLMRIQGITLYHIKSHLQKYRLGKMGRKLWRRDFVPANYYQAGRARAPPMQVQRPSNISNVFNNFNGNGINTMGAEAYGNHPQLLVNNEKPQDAMENFEFPAKFSGLNIGSSSSSTSVSAIKMEPQFSTATPSLLPLFPPNIPASGMNYYPDWSDFVQVGASVAPPPPPPPPRPVEINASLDNYLNSFGNSSSHHEFAPQSYEYSLCSGGGMNFGSFFDEVASFSKVDDCIDHLTSDALLPMEAHEHY